MGFNGELKSPAGGIHRSPKRRPEPQMCLLPVQLGEQFFHFVSA